MKASDAISWMRRRVPVNVLPANFSWYDVLNKGGIDFHNAHSWGFADTTTADIEVRAGEDWIRLPDDFVQIVSAQTTNLGKDAVGVISAASMNEKRSALVEGTSTYWYLCFEGGPPTGTPADGGECWAQVYPTPTADGSPALRISYERGWRKVPENEAGAKLNIRPWCESVFLDFCENAAWEALFDSDPPHEARKAQRLAQLIKKDNDAGAIVGKPRGGVCEDDEDEDWSIDGDLDS